MEETVGEEAEEDETAAVPFSLVSFSPLRPLCDDDAGAATDSAESKDFL